MYVLHYTNVIDWLVSNGLAPDHGNYQAAQEYMDIDIQFAKSHFTEEKLAAVKSEVASMIKSDITYLDAKRIFEYLEQTEKDSTAGTVFTYFTSEMLRSWQTLLRSWEKSNLHLVHATNRLVSWTGQDIPNLERKLLAAEKTVRTIDHR
jgi:CDK5 regulatory subunit-associated protein 3